MIITMEATINPGREALFMADLRVEKSGDVAPKWWGLGLCWWLYRPARWREWLWQWDADEWDGHWAVGHVRLLGLEFDWEWRK